MVAAEREEMFLIYALLVSIVMPFFEIMIAPPLRQYRIEPLDNYATLLVINMGIMTMSWLVGRIELEIRSKLRDSVSRKQTDCSCGQPMVEWIASHGQPMRVFPLGGDGGLLKRYREMGLQAANEDDFKAYVAGKIQYHDVLEPDGAVIVSGLHGQVRNAIKLA